MANFRKRSFVSYLILSFRGGEGEGRDTLCRILRDSFLTPIYSISLASIEP